MTKRYAEIFEFFKILKKNCPFILVPSFPEKDLWIKF